MKSFPKKIAHELTGNLHKNPTKFPENSRAIFLRNDFIIVRLLHLRNPANKTANRRAASGEKPTPEGPDLLSSKKTGQIYSHLHVEDTGKKCPTSRHPFSAIYQTAGVYCAAVV